MAVILHGNVNLGDPELVTFMKDNTDLSWLPSFPSASAPFGQVVEWSTDPTVEFALDPEYKEITARVAGTATTVKGEEEDRPRPGDPIPDQKIQVNTCVRVDYRVLQGNSSYTTTSVYMPITHRLEVSVVSVLFVKQSVSGDQRNAIKTAFDTAELNNPDVAGLQAELLQSGISLDSFEVVPRITYKRYELEYRTQALRRLFYYDATGNGDFGSDEQVLMSNGTMGSIQSWVEERKLKIRYHGHEHLDTVPAPPAASDNVYHVTAEPTDEERREIFLNSAIIMDLPCEDFILYEDKKLATLFSYPEFRVVWRKKQIKIGCVNITISYPQLQWRTAREELYLSIVAEVDIEALIISVAKDCGILAFVTSGVVAYFTANFAAAVKAFKSTFFYCVETRLTEVPKCFIPDLKLIKESNHWNSI